MADQVKQYKDFVAQVTDRLALPAIENYYPMADRPLAKHNGIEITGNFETDDDTTTGRLSYVTVLRDVNTLDPANGYGFAWMKGDGSLYNVYLVDNSPLANDLFISNTFVINENGENTWKAAAKYEILVNTIYSFKMMVGEDYSLSLYIWPANQAQPVTPLLNVGAPLGALSSIGDRFGIGVMGTNNCQWWYDDIVITSTVGIHTAVLYRLKARPSNFPVGTSATLNFYGYGIDGDSPNQLFGATAFIRTLTSGVWNWVEMGSNTSTNASDRMTTKISKEFTIGPEYISDDEFVDMLTTTTYATTSVTDLTTYYVSLEETIGSGVHVGGCADIYVNDPSKIVVAEQTINNITGIVELSAANGFLGPIHSIIDIQIAMVGDSFIPNQDWVYVPGDISNALSIYEYPYISFNPTLSNYKVKVIYRYYQNGDPIQTLMESDIYRYSGTSNVVKIMPPVFVRFNSIQFRGSITDSSIRKLLKDYVHSLTDTISLNEIINLLYLNGVTYIDIPSLDIGIIETDYLRQAQDEVTLVTTYTKPALSAFFTDNYEMVGIGRI